jgi:hypothetical protein
VDQRLSARVSAGFFSGVRISWLFLIDSLGSRQRISFKLVHALDLCPHRDVGDALKDELEQDRDLIFLHKLVSAGESSLELVGALDADGLAAETLSYCHVIDPVPRHSVSLRSRIDVLESETDLEIHLKAALRLTDEAKVGVVHHHVKIGQFVLSADGELLDHN